MKRYLTALVWCLAFLPSLALAQAKSYLVTIESTPSGATVHLDDKSKAPLCPTTPCKPKINVGSHKLFLTLEGYEPFVQDIVIDKSSYKKTFSLTLVRSIKQPVIEVRAKNSNANDAIVTLDGDNIGTIPLSKQTTIGRHYLEVKKQDFSSYAEWVDLKEGETRTISVTLDAIIKDASLEITGLEGAQLYLDGIFKGILPAKIERVSPGRHYVEITKDEYEKFEMWVEVSPGDAKKIEASLKKSAPKISLASVRVFSNADPAELFLDGDAIGKTPFTIEKVSPGEHFVLVKKEGFKSYEEKITLASGENKVMKITLDSTGPKSGLVRVISPQVEAQVYIDGNLLGTAPREANLSPGEHFITVRKPGFREWSKKVSITGDSGPLELVAELVATGNIKILTNLEGADVFLDGEKLTQKSFAEGTPLELKDLSVGEHTISVRLDKYREFTDTVVVTAGDTRLVQATLLKIGPSAEELLSRRRSISTYSARILSPGNLAIDFMAGIPYLLEVHFATGLPENNKEVPLPLEIGVDLKIAGSINEIYARAKYQLLNTSVFGVAVEGSLGGGLGPAKAKGALSFSANSFDVTANAIASIFFRDLLSVSGRIGLHAYTDGSKDDDFVAAVGADTRDNGARLVVGLATQIHKPKVTYNILLSGNPGGLGSGTDNTDPANPRARRAMYEQILPFNDPLLYLQVGATLKF